MFHPEYIGSLSVDELVNRYDAILVNLVEIHATLLEKNVRMRPHTAWYNDDLRDAKQERRRRERTWRKSKLKVHKQMFCTKCNLLIDMLLHAKTTFYSEKNPGHWKKTETNNLLPRTLFLAEIITQTFPLTSHNAS